MCSHTLSAGALFDTLIDKDIQNSLKSPQLINPLSLSVYYFIWVFVKSEQFLYLSLTVFNLDLQPYIFYWSNLWDI